MWKWIAAVLALVVVVFLFFALRPHPRQEAIGDPETRIVAYLKENIRPGQPVLVTQLYNNVFTSPEDREALQRLYATLLKIPASAAEIYTKTGKIPTRDELSREHGLKVPGEIDVFLRILDYDPRVPKFFERDSNTGEITNINVSRIIADENFGRPLRNR